MSIPKIEGTPEAWEDGVLGRDEAHAKAASKEMEQQLDDGLGLQMISIRLQKELIEDYKKIAEFHGLGYQPLMRDALKRFAEAEFKKIAIEYANLKASKAAEKNSDPDSPDGKPGGHGRLAA